MNFDLKATTSDVNRRNGRPKGFALVATLSLMVLLLIIALAMLNQSAIERGSSQRGDSMAVAREKAGGIENGKEAKSDANQPNVLFIAVDDMNDWVGFLQGYPGVKTPNLDRLAKKGINFTNAHCPSPMCGPSRAAIMSGRYPHNTGIYNNRQWWRPEFPDMITIPMHFKANGYHVAGAGKIFHHTAGFNPPDQWDDYHRLQFDDPWDRNSKLNYPWVGATETPAWHPLNGLEYALEFDWGVLPDKEESDYGDAISVDWSIDYLQSRTGDKPFFLACGLFHPHMPWYAPQKYFDLYPLENIRLPEVLENDLNDIPPGGLAMAAANREHFERIKKAGKWKEAVQAYLASISFADAQIGRLLDALEESGKSDNTIIVFWSDHGWHLGEKQHWHKGTLWQRATRVPFIVVNPKNPNSGNCDTPVNLIDIFKTLNDLCGLPDLKQLDGESLLPLLNNIDGIRNRPSLSAFQKGNFSLQDKRYHYIQYDDGGEELYDHISDKNEWYNLANDNDHKDIIKKFRKYIPKEQADNIPEKSAYRFDFESYKWFKL